MMADPEMPSLIAGMLAESDSDPEMPGLTDSSSSSSESSDDGDASMMAQIARLSDLADGEEPVLPTGWRKNLIGAPLPPDATSYLQEPDTHEHSQLKAEYRETKADLHFALEQEYQNSHKNDDTNVPKRRPYEVLHIAGESLRRFNTKCILLVPQGTHCRLESIDD